MMEEWIDELTDQVYWLTELIHYEEKDLEIAYEHDTSDIQRVIDEIEDKIRIYRARKEALEQRIIFLRKSMDRNGGLRSNV